MPDRRAHRRVGRPAGAVYAGFRAAGVPSGDVIIEGLAGLFGGDVGSGFPDWLEPGCWHHRRTCHSWLAGVSLTGLANQVEEWAETCRRRAADHRRRSSDPTIPPEEQLWHNLVTLFWSALAGFLNGLLAGYLSHLALDLGTKSRLPIC